MSRVRTQLNKFFSNLWAWCVDHPIEAITLAITVFGVGRKLMKPIRNAIEQYRQNHPNEMFDPSLGLMLKLKRRLTEEDKKELSRLYDEGVSRHDSLKKLNLI